MPKIKLDTLFKEKREKKAVLHMEDEDPYSFFGEIQYCEDGLFVGNHGDHQEIRSGHRLLMRNEKGRRVSYRVIS